MPSSSDHRVLCFSFVWRGGHGVYVDERKCLGVSFIFLTLEENVGEKMNSHNNVFMPHICD